MPPTISNISPAPDATITRSQAVQWDITGEDELTWTHPEVHYPNLGRREVIHDGTSFLGAYASLSTRTVISGGYRFTVRHESGWPDTPTFYPYADGLENLVATIAELDSRLDTAESDINALEAADTALDGRLDKIEPWAAVSMAANQTANLSVNNHIEFDQISQVGGLVSLATGAGQADGLITLASGHIYQLQASIAANLTNGETQYQWRTHPDDAGVASMDGSGEVLFLIDSGSVAAATHYHAGTIVIDCRAGAKTVKLDCITIVSGSVNNISGRSRIMIRTLAQP